MRSILVLRGGALGDFVVTLPTLAALRARWPKARIELAGNAVAAQLARSRGLLDRVHSQHEARWAALYASTPLSTDFAQWLGTFDLVVSYWPDPDGTVNRHFPVVAGQKFVTAPAMPTRGPAAAHYGEALRPLGIQVTDYLYRLDEASPVKTNASGPGKRIAIHPGSGSARKNWPAENWCELIGRLDEPVLLILGDAEAQTWSDSRILAGAIGARVQAGQIELARALPLEELVNGLGSCRLFVGHDSGISHLAAACGVPSVLLFGPTDASVWAPPSALVTVVQRGDNVGEISVAEVCGVVRERLAAAG